MTCAETNVAESEIVEIGDAHHYTDSIMNRQLSDTVTFPAASKTPFPLPASGSNVAVRKQSMMKTLT